MPPKIMNDIFKLRNNVIICGIYHKFLQIQLTVSLTVVNQLRLWDSQFGNKYSPKLKTSNLLMVLKKELEG